MHPFSNRGIAVVRSWLAAILFALLLFAPTGAAEEEMTVFTVTSTGGSGAGTLEAAILAANALPAGSGFQIAIAVDGTLPASTPLGISGRFGWLAGRPGATITGFSCVIAGGGSLTLEDAIIDNSTRDMTAIRVQGENPENTLILKGSSRITGRPSGSEPNILFDDAHLAVDKAPGGTNLDSALILTGTDRCVFGSGRLLVRGGTLEAHGTRDGISFIGNINVTGGKLAATGGSVGMSVHFDAMHVQIYGGNIVARGERADIIDRDGAEVFGGSLDARIIANGVWDENRNPLYLVTVTVGAPPVANAEVACTQNGDNTFTSMTDAEGRLYLWMRPSDEVTVEIDTGEAVYRASGAVEENYDNTMLATAVPPVVTDVIVTPSSVRAERGTTVRFSARVEGEYYPSQDVIWKVENGHGGTFISGEGLLTISETESSRTLIVTAISAYDESKSGEAVVTVTGVSLEAILLLIAIALVILLAALLALL